MIPLPSPAEREAYIATVDHHAGVPPEPCAFVDGKCQVRARLNREVRSWRAQVNSGRGKHRMVVAGTNYRRALRELANHHCHPAPGSEA